jgi:hypothetical protein
VKEVPEPDVPQRTFGWSDMFVSPEDDPRADNGHADLIRERIDGRVGH